MHYQSLLSIYSIYIKFEECIASNRSSNLGINTSKDNILILQSNHRPNNSLTAIRKPQNLLHLNRQNLPIGLHHAIVLCVLLQQHSVVKIPLHLRSHSRDSNRISLPRNPRSKSLNSVLERLHCIRHNKSLIEIKHDRKTPRIQHP